MPSFAHGGEALAHALGQVDGGHGHEGARLVAGVAEHHALVARADALVGVARGQAVGRLPALVHALRDVGALLVDGVHHAAGVAVEAVLGAVVADAAHHLAHDGRHVHVRLRADLARHGHEPRGSQASRTRSASATRRRAARWGRCSPRARALSPWR